MTMCEGQQNHMKFKTTAGCRIVLVEPRVPMCAFRDVDTLHGRCSEMLFGTNHQLSSVVKNN